MELLDDLNIEVKRKPVYSVLTLLLLFVFTYLLYYIGSSIELNDDNNLFQNEFAVFLGTIVIFLSGLVTCIISLVRKEKPTFIKMIGVIIYAFIILAVILSFLL